MGDCVRCKIHGPRTSEAKLRPEAPTTGSGFELSFPRATLQPVLGETAGHNIKACPTYLRKRV